ncbi:MAG: DUF1501 domain-containing protein [Planctomycetaceae bacterium]
MLRVLGSTKRLCTGLRRREFLQVGGLGAAAAMSGSVVRASQDTATLPGFGRAKQCIILFLYGSPSQLETFDMKPEAPVEIRGTMQPIASSLPGLDVCEHLPLMSRIMDRTTVMRSVTHPYPLHGVAFAMTGVPAIDVAMELNPHDLRHHPWFGSVVEALDRRSGRERSPHAVQNLALPFPFSSQRTDQPFRAGPYGAYLGNALNPVYTEFLGEGTKTITKERTGFAFTGLEPYLGCTEESHFRLAGTGLVPDVTVDRLDRRRSLLDQFDRVRRDLDRTLSGQALSSFQDQALSLVTSTKVREALDVRQESRELREQYGMTLFGQGCLAARRMLEAGTRLATVFWDEYGLAGDAWDTHTQHYPRMKEQLLPPFDRAVSGLLLDLEQRGMLDETLVAVMSEHGRTPRLDNSPGGGRDHWARAYSALFFGGGIAKGRVVGATDNHASDVADHPVSPKDLLATMYHLLGINPHTFLPDRTGRPVPLVPDSSRVVEAMLA